MGRRARAAAHLARDAVVTVFSVLLIATTQNSEEMAALLLQGLGAVFIVLSIADVALVVLFYIPISGWLIWRLMDRTSSLEARVAALEGHPIEKKEK